MRRLLVVCPQQTGEYKLGRIVRTAVAFGAEGLGNPWEARCDELLAIPMPGGADSLNVAGAAGIFLYALSGRA